MVLNTDADALRQLVEEGEVEPALKGCSEASSITALVWPSNSTGSTTTLTRVRLAEAGGDA